MTEESELWAAMAAAQARLDRALEEARQAAREIAELSRRAAAAPKVPVERDAPAPIQHARDTRLHRGKREDRLRAFVEALGRLAQPFTVVDARWLTRFGQRTVERFLTSAVQRRLLVRERKGRYRVAPPPPG